MKRLAFALLIVGLAASGLQAAAQEPPPLPLSLTLRLDSSDMYRLEIRDEFGAIGAYEVSALVQPIGSDQAVITRIAESDEDALSLALGLPLDFMRGGCYRVAFFVTPVGAQGHPAESARATLETRGCVDASGATSFPAFDNVTTPPPAPPTNVRLVPQGDDWRVAWDPAPGEVMAYQASAALLDAPWAAGGSTLATVTFPEVPSDWRTVGPFSFFGFTDQPPPAGCGSALVLVFAIGPDSPSVWPGNATVPFCWDGTALTFPATGDGAAGGGGRSIGDGVALVMAVAGVCLLASGVVRRPGT